MEVFREEALDNLLILINKYVNINNFLEDRILNISLNKNI
jgi:hypothetical protein